MTIVFPFSAPSNGTASTMRTRRSQFRWRHSAPPAERRGAAAVEFAICIPLMLLITFGAIEAANGIYLKQVATQAAYEVARTATSMGRTQSEAIAIGKQVLAARSIQDSSISVSPTVDSNTPAGTEVTVIVTAPSNSNAYAPLWYFKDTQVRAQVVMIRN
jgi:Flp pilus assembly protein TadG